MIADSVAVLDFETNGLSPAQQARATEVAVVIVEGGKVVDRYQSLMNSGALIPSFIEQLTGISNAMLRKAPPAAEVMQNVADFVGARPLIAHNASFDQKFWDAELAVIRRRREQAFACSLLLARRLLPQAPSHKLGVLNRWIGLPDTGTAHRAMADAEMAANLVCFMADLLRERHGICEISHQTLCDLQRVPAAKMAQTLQRMRECS